MRRLSCICLVRMSVTLHGDGLDENMTGTTYGEQVFSYIQSTDDHLQEREF